MFCRNYKLMLPFILTGMTCFYSCSTMEKVSMHGFTSGYYQMDSSQQTKSIYADVTDEKVDIYNQHDQVPDKEICFSIPLVPCDSLLNTPLKFRKQSLDIDLTTIFFKYRPSVYGLPPQLTTDLNIAVYAGWRVDTYKVYSSTDPLNRRRTRINNLGYDFGVFAGAGSTSVNSYTSNNRSNLDYNGMILQTGMAGFLESTIASFGIAVGIDYLLNRDRKIWIYNNKPWIGFILGIALN